MRELVMWLWEMPAWDFLRVLALGIIVYGGLVALVLRAGKEGNRDDRGR